MNEAHHHRKHLDPTRNSDKVFPPDDDTSFFSKKRTYLSYAWDVSYLMQGKSTLDSAFAWFEGLWDDSNSPKPRRVQSFLGGAFLRMYLEHKVDPDIIKSAGAEIGASPEFIKLQNNMNMKLSHLGARGHNKGAPSREEVAAFYAKELDRTRKKQGIQFRYTLNAVIGGVTGVRVTGARIVSAASDSKVDYDVDVVFTDTYDFANKRTGVYQAYRQKLAHLLAVNDFAEFESEYNREARPFGHMRRHSTTPPYLPLSCTLWSERDGPLVRCLGKLPFRCAQRFSAPSRPPGRRDSSAPRTPTRRTRAQWYRRLRRRRAAGSHRGPVRRRRAAAPAFQLAQLVDGSWPACRDRQPRGAIPFKAVQIVS